VLACAPGEWHEGSLLILGALLRRRRISVAYLGQAVPLEELATIVDDLEPRVIVLSAMRQQTAQELVDWPRQLALESDGSAPVVSFGGRVFTEHPEWRQRVPGVFLGGSLEEGLAAVERLLG
jgi:methanogenic corrinoid protein MtbC1